MSSKNVIQFPSKARSRPTSQGKTRYDLEQKKVLISASLFSIVLVVSLANRVLLRSNSEVVNQRSLASVDGVSTMNSQWEKSVAQSLSSNRAPASVGQSPAAMDQLRVGTLQGKYMVRFENGKITEIESDSKELPEFAGSKEFLDEQRELINAKFSSAVLTDKQISTTKVVESYDLMDSTKVVATADFEMDISGHLVHFQTHSIR